MLVANRRIFLDFLSYFFEPHWSVLEQKQFFEIQKKRISPRISVKRMARLYRRSGLAIHQLIHMFNFFRGRNVDIRVVTMKLTIIETVSDDEFVFG